MQAAEKKDELADARSQALAQLESIKEMVEALNAAIEADDDEAREKAETCIQEDALCVEVRSTWHVLGTTETPDEFKILLCTGGPAVQIVGDLSEHAEPETARLECQDWFQPWTDVYIQDEDREALMTYARCFYFGE